MDYEDSLKAIANHARKIHDMVSDLQDQLAEMVQQLASKHAELDTAHERIATLENEAVEARRLGGLCTIATITERSRQLERFLRLGRFDRRGFLDLPGELRNQIYDHVLIQEEPIRVGVALSYSYPVTRTSHRLLLRLPALLQTCRQVRAEASSIYYVENDFAFRQGLCEPPVSHNWWRSAEGHLDKLKTLAGCASEVLAVTGISMVFTLAKGAE